MAATIDIYGKLDSLVECSICQDIFNDPRQLPCMHTYCLGCVEGFSSHKLPGHSAACPLCRKEFVIPDNGVSDLPKNFFIEHLKDELQQVKISSNVCCNECGANCGRNYAVLCQQCRKTLCGRCFNSHDNNCCFGASTPCDADVRGKREEYATVAAYCEKHSNRRLDLYCMECNTTVCLVCLREHKGHEIGDAATFEHHRQLANVCTGLLRSLNKEKSDFSINIADIKRQIVDQAHTMTTKVEEAKQKLLEDLRSIETNRIEEISIVEEMVDQHLRSAEHEFLNMKELWNEDFLCDIGQKSIAFQSRTRAMTSLNAIQQAINKHGTTDVRFTGSNSLIQLNDNLLGTIDVLHSPGSKPLSLMKTCDKPLSLMKTCDLQQAKATISETDEHHSVTVKPTYKQHMSTESTGANELPSTMKLVDIQPSVTATTTSSCGTPIAEQGFVEKQPTRNHSIRRVKTLTPQRIIRSDGREVLGLTTLGNFLLVARERQIAFYETTNFTLLEETVISVQRSNDFITGLASCPVNQCAYASDLGGVIHKINMQKPTKNKALKLGTVQGVPCGLSVNSATNLIITCLDSRIVEYTAHGVLVREIRLPAAMAHPRHAVQLDNGLLLVSHGWTNDSIHQVCIIDADGNTMVSYGNKRGSSCNQLNEPIHLAVDSSGLVLIADRENDRIVVLDQSLCWSSNLSIVVDGRPQGPCVIQLDCTRDRLYVAEEKGQCVLVFDYIGISMEQQKCMD